MGQVGVSQIIHRLIVVKREHYYFYNGLGRPVSCVNVIGWRRADPVSQGGGGSAYLLSTAFRKVIKLHVITTT